MKDKKAKTQSTKVLNELKVLIPERFEMLKVC